MPVDIIEPDEVRQMVQKTYDHYGRLDVLINNAGRGLRSPVEHIDLNDFAYIMSLNVYGPVVAMQSAIPIMRKQGGGTIVNLSSQVARGHISGPLGLCGHQICTHNDLSHCTQGAGGRRNYSICSLS